MTIIGTELKNRRNEFLTRLISLNLVFVKELIVISSFLKAELQDKFNIVNKEINDGKDLFLLLPVYGFQKYPVEAQPV